jgi:alkanesulfonate monooxygenase
VGAEHADVYMLWGEPVAQIAERIAGIRTEAARHGRTVRFSLSVRPIVGQTEEAAWQRAEQIRAATEKRVAGAGGGQDRGTPVQGTQVQGIQVPDTPGPARRMFGFRESSSVGSERLQQQAAEREVYDDRLWYGVTRLTGPGGNSTALVGTARQVADALTAYRRVGVDTVLIRGFDPLDDVVEWGRELVPLLREEAARTPVGAPGAAESALSA